MKLQAAVTRSAAGSFAGPGLDLGYASAPGFPGRAAVGAVHAAAVDLANGTYLARVQESDDDVTYADRSPAVAVTRAGWTSCPARVGKRYVRVVMTVAQTAAGAAANAPPAVTYQAWLDTKFTGM